MGWQDSCLPQSQEMGLSQAAPQAGHQHTVARVEHPGFSREGAAVGSRGSRGC